MKIAPLDREKNSEHRGIFDLAKNFGETSKNNIKISSTQALKSNCMIILHLLYAVKNIIMYGLFVKIVFVNILAHAARG